jgi:hypothetical protein
MQKACGHGAMTAGSRRPTAKQRKSPEGIHRRFKESNAHQAPHGDALIWGMRQSRRSWRVMIEAARAGDSGAKVAQETI